MNDFHQAETSPINMPGISTNIISDNRNMIIIGFIVLLILAVLGINILYISGYVLQYTTDIFEPFIFNILSLIGYGTGTILNKTADVAGDTTKLGVDIAEGTVHSIGDLLKNASNPNIDNETRKNLDDAINIANKPFDQHAFEHRAFEKPEDKKQEKPEDKKQEKPEDKKQEEHKEHFRGMHSWDYDGENQQKYGYINVSDYGKSISGQVFPSQSTAINPIINDPNRNRP